MMYVLVTGSKTANSHHSSIMNALSIERSHPLVVQDPIILHLNQTKSMYNRSLQYVSLMLFL